jgi:PAS domain-containing protein
MRLQVLADVLDEMRGRLADEIERRIAVSRRPKFTNGTRRARLDALLAQVIHSLRRGSAGDLRQVIAPVSDPEIELDEHEAVASYLLEKIERKDLETSPGESAMVHAWRYEADRGCLLEQNRRLTALLDGVNESAALLTPEGRLLYCNRRAAQALHEVVGLAPGELVGKMPAELGVPLELVIGRPVSELRALARAHESFEFNVWGRAKETQFDAIYAPDGSVVAIALLVRDIHGYKQAQTRLGLLSKLSGLAGILDYQEVAQRLAWVPIPELADWVALSVVEGKRIQRTFLASRDPSKMPLQEALKRAAPSWARHPLWQELLAGGFQLLTEVTDDLLQKMAVTQEQYRLLSQLHLQSLLVIPLVLRGHTTSTGWRSPCPGFSTP